MNKNIKLSILVSGLLLISGCGSNSTTSNTQPVAKAFATPASVQSLQTLHAGTNNAPKASAKTYCTIENTKLNDAKLCASDEDNDTMTYAIGNLNNSKGVVVLNTSTGFFDYTPADNFVGTYNFQFVAIDEHNVTSEPVTITIIVKEQEVQLQAPIAPTNLEANATSSTAIKLTWKDKSDNESGFVIYQDGVAVKYVEENIESITINALEEGKTYDFKIRAKNSAGCSILSSKASATTLSTQTAPNAPENLKVIAKNETCIRLKWDDKSDNESGFKIYNGTTLVKTVEANHTCATISGLSAETEYTFKVVAFNNSGEASAEVTDSTTIHINYAPVAYTKTFSTYVDTNLSGKLCAYDANGDSLTYDVNTSDLNGTLELNSTSGKFVYSPTTGFEGLDKFLYTVSDETNTSESKEVFIHVNQADGTKPEAPTELNVTVDDTNFYLNWKDNSDNENDFRIFRNGNHIVTVAADETNATIAIGDLNISEKYRFEVRATNGLGCSDAAATECKVWTK